MSEIDEDEAFATARLVDAVTGETIGYVYTWKDGVEQPLWLYSHRDRALRVDHAPKCNQAQENNSSKR